MRHRRIQIYMGKNKKKRSGMLGLFTIGFGAIIGVGWIVSVGEWLDMAGGVAPVVTAFAMATLILLPITKAYGEMITILPEAEGGISGTCFVYGKGWAFAGGWFWHWRIS